MQEGTKKEGGGGLPGGEESGFTAPHAVGLTDGPAECRHAMARPGGTVELGPMDANGAGAERGLLPALPPSTPPTTTTVRANPLFHLPPGRAPHPHAAPHAPPQLAPLPLPLHTAKPGRTLSMKRQQGLPPWRKKVSRVVYRLEVQALVAVAVLADLVLLVFDLRQHEHGQGGRDAATIAILVFLLLEFALRMVANDFGYFWRKYFNWIDFVVLALSLVLYIIDTAETKTAAKIATTGRFLHVLRGALRGIRALRVAVKAKQGLDATVMAARMQVSMNKQRYQEGGFNLDLTFITERMLAMSVPATSIMGLYRNPIKEVVRYFETNHTRNGTACYRIYNVCPELPYPHDKFTGEVRCYNVQDHTPPRMNHFVDYCLDVEQWMARSANNIIAIHCKGGKGRTGSLCAAWMIYSQYKPTAGEALSHFAVQRTDPTLKGKLQGVETPSQMRYIHQFFAHLERTNAFLGGSPLTYLRDTTLRLKAVKGEALFAAADNGNGAAPSDTKRARREIYATVWCNGDIITSSDSYAVDEDGNFLIEFNQIEVSGDVRINVFETDVAKRKMTAPPPGTVYIAGKEPGLQLFFWFHTDFVPDNFELGLPEIDKACKNKNNKSNGSGKLRTLFERDEE